MKWLAWGTTSLRSDAGSDQIAMALPATCQALFHATVLSNVKFLEHDIRVAWPVADRSADVIVGNLILEHLRDLAPVMAECARVLRVGGQLYLSELHPFRQILGGQAHFTDPHTRETVHVPAFKHSVSDYVGTGIAAGLSLRELDEWLEADAAANDPPRLLTLLFERR